MARVIAPNLVEERSHELRTVCGEVEAILDAKQRAGFAADHPIHTRSSVYEVMSVQGLGRLIKLPHSVEEWRARAKEDGGGYEDGVAAVRVRRERQYGLSHAASRLQFVARVQESQAGAG